MDIKLDLITQDPILFNEIIIYQPTFNDIKKYGTEQFNQLLLPFSLTFDILNISEEEQQNKNLFEDIILKDEMLFGLLILSLQYFCKTEDISFVENGIKVNEWILNKDNFDEFGEILLQICAREKMKIEKPPVFKNERQRDIWEKLQEGRRRSQKNEELQFYDILNIVEFGGKFHISIEIIKGWTLWRIMNAYKSIIGRDNYDSSFSIFLISGEQKLIEKHWTQQIKVS